jgi:lysophospholipase L1-like esterase
VNALLQRMARETGARYVNLWPLFLDARGRLDARYTNDGLHLNPLGYERWVRYLKQSRFL